MNNKIILFDGVCNFCSFWVRFVSKRNKSKSIKFASLQSDIGQTLLKQNHIDTNSLSTVVFIDEEKVYLQSSAAFQISKYLDGAWKLLYVLMIIPKSIRDIGYNFIARNRYKWFGKSEACLLPNAELKDRFL
jgi:predicted DCC family thiol-disulfide oxidoreductase YuxK